MRKLLSTLLLSLSASLCQAELPVFQAVDDLHAVARDRIAAGQFESLLDDADKDLASQERFADGRWKLAILLGGMRRGFKADAKSAKDWTRFESALTALAKKHPASPNAWLFVAVLEDSHAWALRGGGYADTVTDDGEQGFLTHLGRSRTLLNAHPMPANPAWFELEISVRGALGEPPAALDRIFAEAMKQEAGYQQTWYSRMMFLEPKWGGRPEDMVAFINLGTQITSPTEGRGMMSRLLRYALEDGYPETARLPGIDWESVKTSFDDVLQHFPDDTNSQWAFIQACTRGDRPEALRLLDFVKQPPSDILFGESGFGFSACADWARRRAASFQMTDPATHELRRVR